MANNNDKKGMLINVQPLKTKQEVNELIEALGISKEFGLRNQLLFKLGISTGLRCGDLVALKVEQLKGKSSFKIREGKTKKERTVYLNNLMADIADYIETLPQETVYLFPSRKGDGHITTTQAYRIIAKAGDMIGNHSIGTHTMRKTFGYTYYQATKDVATLMEIFNHSSQKTTLRYIGITEEAIENSIKSVSFFQVDNIPASKLIRNIFFAFAEFEYDMIVERTQEGKAIVRQNPDYREGRKPTYTKKQLEHALEMLESNSYNQVAEKTGISKVH